MKCTKHKCISQSPHTVNFCNHYFEQLNNRMLSPPQKFSLHQLLSCLCPKWDHYPSFHGNHLFDFSCNMSDNALLNNKVNFSFELYLSVNMGPIPELGRSPGGGHGNALQILAWRIPMGRGAWSAIVHGIAKSCTQLDTWVHHAHTLYITLYLAPLAKCYF